MLSQYCVTVYQVCAQTIQTWYHVSAASDVNDWTDFYNPYLINKSFITRVRQFTIECHV